MRVAEIVIEVPASRQRDAERVAYALGAQGIELRDGARGRVSVVLWLPSTTTKRTIEAAVAGIPDARVHVRRVEASWWQPPPPRRLGRRFVIVGSDDANTGKREAIKLTSALTFGDGAHVTTALCVEVLERTLATRKVHSVLDVGTGTGVLAIVAGKLGARDIVATDIDPLARDSARRALRENDVRARVQTAIPKRRFELVVANLYLEPLVALAPQLAACVDGTLIVSGFTNADAVTRALEREGLLPRARRVRDTWVCLELTRQPRSTTGARSPRR